MSEATNYPWTQGEDNLFSANHRNGMVVRHGGTMAQHYSVEDIETEYNKRLSDES